MTLYDELIARGLIAQVTDEEKVKELINSGKATFYIGFRPHRGLPARGPLHGPLPDAPPPVATATKPIALLGGGTALIGDPSGKTDMRKMLTAEDHQAQRRVLQEADVPLHRLLRRQSPDGQQRRLAAEAELRGAAAGGGRLLLREQYAPG